MSASPNDPLDILVLVAIVAVIAAIRKFGLGRLLSGPRTVEDSEADSALITFYTAGHFLTKASEGKLDDMRYSTYFSMPDGRATAFVNTIAAINVLDLPFNTQTHLVGLSKEHGIDRVKFADFVRGIGMERVVLEGDFADYFDIYAAKGQQVSVREVLDPAAMEYVVDYCRSHFWEINGSELYFVASSDDKTSASIFEEGWKFVSQIKPALLPGQPGAAAVHHQVAYGEYDGPALFCPLCQQTMSLNGLYHVCPVGHGILISGREILGLRNHQVELSIDGSNTLQHGPLTCPHCHHPMTRVNYEESGVFIDSCEHCPYRWLDADELSKMGSKV